MTILPPVSVHSTATDLLLADGSKIYMDGLSRWFRVIPGTDGEEEYIGTAGQGRPATVDRSEYAYPSMAAYHAAIGYSDAR